MLVALILPLIVEQFLVVLSRVSSFGTYAITVNASEIS
jgi:hypothetical protein